MPAFVAVVVGAVVVTSGCTVWRLNEARALVERSEPLQRAPANAAQRLLIVGDSTGVGTGATTPQTSVAGLLAQAWPRLQIDNRASNGAKLADVRDQLENANERYDVVLVLAGSNDVMRLRSQAAMQRDLESVAELARARSDHVLLMPGGNVGNAQFFFAPVSWYMSARSRSLHAMVRETAARHQAVYVNLYQERDQDPLARQPKLMRASDGLHPSDAGYRVWFDTLTEQAQLATLLAPSQAR
ncbi:MAG: GDSL-type esterase/lipase family protein [Comamonas sp.]